MKQVTSWLQCIRLRQIITVFLVALTFFVSTAFDKYGNELQAQAETVTPEATNYQIDSTDSQLRVDTDKVKGNAQNVAKDNEQATKNAKENTQDAGKNLIQNIRKKLNLDEPTDVDTL